MDASTTEGGLYTENQGDIENKEETITRDGADNKGESPKANINQNEATEDDNDASDRQNTDTKPMSPRLSRLLEPLRSLHSLGAIHIVWKSAIAGISW